MLYPTVENLIMNDVAYIIVLSDGQSINCTGDEVFVVSTGGAAINKSMLDVVIGDKYIDHWQKEKVLKHENPLF